MINAESFTTKDSWVHGIRIYSKESRFLKCRYTFPEVLTYVKVAGLNFVRYYMTICEAVMWFLRNWRIEYHKRKAKKYLALAVKFKNYQLPIQSYDYFLKVKKHVRKGKRLMEGKL